MTREIIHLGAFALQEVTKKSQKMLYLVALYHKNELFYIYIFRFVAFDHLTSYLHPTGIGNIETNASLCLVTRLVRLEATPLFVPFSRCIEMRNPKHVPLGPRNYLSDICISNACRE